MEADKHLPKLVLFKFWEILNTKKLDFFWGMTYAGFASMGFMTYVWFVADAGACYGSVEVI